ncbi:hypothetical protein [Deinococcus maricopensis]|uniref:Uncharacterized protein n=1 Tax=Deinococcus maricopensis (strain DSM 21211 / LMG 22137 / NRRL B-23946 / LB-34) TaxID=709986 RepID=E8U521_DEIML|nr:hypothetical protein [Deinococcus maricopensis]ADV66160.1 hypothetical protein Deima_0501 [Deinococcus maricopensis DSM 21211]
MNLYRQLMGAVGLMIGFGLYAFADRLSPPWNSVLIGALLAALGVTTFVYARGERWIQVLGVILIAYGALRAFVLH